MKQIITIMNKALMPGSRSRLFLLFFLLMAGVDVWGQIPAATPEPTVTPLVNFYSTKYGTETWLSLNISGGTTAMSQVEDTNANDIIKLDPVPVTSTNCTITCSEEIVFGDATKFCLYAYPEENITLRIQVRVDGDFKSKTTSPLTAGVWNVIEVEGIEEFETKILQDIRITITNGNSSTLYLDHLFFYSDNAFTAASTPTLPLSEVVNVFSTEYADNGFAFLGSNFSEVIDANGNDIVKIADFASQSIKYDGSLSIEGKNYLHLDVYAEAAMTTMKVKLINDDGAKEVEFDSGELDGDKWNSLDIDISSFLEGNTTISAIELSDPNSTATTIYLDHIYFYTRIPAVEESTPSGSFSIYDSTSDPQLMSGWTFSPTEFYNSDTSGKPIVGIASFGAGTFAQHLNYTGNSIGSNNRLHLEIYPLDTIPLTVALTHVGSSSSNTYPLDSLTPNAWNPVNIDISSFVLASTNRLTTISLTNSGSPTVAYLDHVYLYEDVMPLYSPYLPPVRGTGNVISVYGAAYDSGLADSYPLVVEESQTTQLSEVSITNIFADSLYNKVWKLANTDRLSLSLDSEPLDVSQMDSLHLDIYPIGATSIKIVLDSEEIQQTLTQDKWNRVTIPVTLSEIAQLGFTGGAGHTFFISNVYFYKAQTAIASKPDPIEVNKGLGRGMNIGSVLEDKLPSSHPFSISLIEQMIDTIAGRYFDHIRLPVAWNRNTRSSFVEPYNINPAFLKDTVQHIVDYALSQGQGLKVILNIHHFDEMDADPTKYKPQFLAYWTQLADYFKNYDNDLLFELYNEPHGSFTSAIWETCAQEARDIIRQTNPNRTLLVGTAEYGGLQALPRLVLPKQDATTTDDNLITTVHYYNPAYVVNQGWNNTGNGDVEWWDTETERDYLDSFFGYIDQFRANNNYVPIHVGEFGAYNRGDVDSRVLWTTYVRDAFEKKGYSWAYWELRAGFGIYTVDGSKLTPDITMINALLHNEVPKEPAEHTFDATETIYSGSTGWSSSGGSLTSSNDQLVFTFSGGDIPDDRYVRQAFELSKDETTTYRISFKAKASVGGFTYTLSAMYNQEPWSSIGVLPFTPETEEEVKEFSFLITPLMSFVHADNGNGAFIPTRLNFGFGGITGTTPETVTISDFKIEKVTKKHEAVSLPTFPEEKTNIFSSTLGGDQAVTFSNSPSKTEITDTNGNSIIQLSDFSSQTISLSSAIDLAGKGALHLSAFAGSVMDVIVKVSGTGTPVNKQFKLASHTWTSLNIDLGDLSTISSIELSGGTGTGRKLFLDHIYLFAPFEAAPTPTQSRPNDVISIFSTKYGNRGDLDLSEISTDIIDEHANNIIKTTTFPLTLELREGISLADIQAKNGLHLDIYPIEAGRFTVELHNNGGIVASETSGEVTAGQWNEIDLLFNNISGSEGAIINKIVITATTSPSGVIKLKASAEDESEDITAYIDHVYFYDVELVAVDGVLVWTGATDNDWNNPANWHIGTGIPGANTDVYIPGKDITYYPFLTGAKAYNLCRNIYILQGGEIGRQDLLTYDRAHVQLNWGLDVTEQQTNATVTDLAYPASELTGDDLAKHLAFSAANSTIVGGTTFTGATSTNGRERWVLLTAPLKGLYSGDFSFGGYPNVYMQQIRVEDGIAMWSNPFADNDVALNAGVGFALFVRKGDNAEGLGYQETDGTAGLQHVNGIVEFPYYENAVMSAAHRIHRYNDNDSTSDLHSIYNDNFEVSENDKITVTRNPEADYRFIMEDVGEKLTVVTGALEAGSEILIGNPYMSTIDFEELIAANSSVLGSFYRIWTGNGYNSYKFDNASLPEGEDYGTGDLTKYIAPMQSFLVRVNNAVDAEGLKLNYPATLSTNTNTYPGLKAPQVASNKSLLRIKAKNVQYSSEALLVMKEGFDTGYNPQEDVYKLFTNISNVPEVYTVIDGTAIEINCIGKPEELTIPLGLKTNMLGETTFTLSGMDNFSKDVYLIDNYLEKTIKITNLTEYVYTFTNQVAGIQEDRFQLKLAPAGTSIESVEDALYLRAWIEGDEIRILSSPGNPIKSLALYDMQGRVIYATDSVDAFDYTSAIHLPDRQVYILSIVTEKTIKRIKIVK